MAISEETKAIIKRLKEEGELIRDTGTNSLKSMNIRLEKFDGLFTSINNNIQMQTEVLQAQLGIAQDAIEKQRSSEQFDEIAAVEKQTKSDNAEKAANDAAAQKETDKKIDNIAAAISSGFSLKNFAMGAAGLFVGYNLLKGFVDEKTNGGWTAFESNLGNMAKGLGGIDFSTLPQTFSNLQASLDGIGESLASLRNTLDTIMSIGWLDVAQGVLTSIGLLTAYNLTMRTALKLLDRNGGGGAGGRRGFFRRLLAGGVTGEVLRRIFRGDPDLDAEVRAKAGAVNPANRTNPVDSMSAEERARLRSSDPNLKTSFTPDGVNYNPPTLESPDPKIRVVQIGPDNFRYQDMGAGNAFIRSDVAQSRLAAAGYGRDGTPTIDRTSPKVPPVHIDGPRNYGPRQGDAGLGRARADTGKLILAEKRGIIARMARNKIGKVILMGVPIVGAVASLGYAIWNFAKGDFTSAALQVASIPLPTVSGTAIDIGSVATEIFHAITNESFNPLNEGHVVIMEGIGEELHQAYEEWMADKERQARDTFDMLPEDQRAAITAGQEYIVGGGRPGMREAGDGNFANQSLGQDYYTGADVRLSDSPYFKGNYVRNAAGRLMFTDRNGVAYVQGQNERDRLTTIETMGDGYGKLTTIQPTTIAPVNQNFTITEGNKNVSMTNVGGGGGGGSVSREIGLTSGIAGPQ
jgi:hypothetical protein